MSGLGHVAPVACCQLPMPVRRTAFGDSGHSVMSTWMVALSLRQSLAKDRSWPVAVLARLATQVKSGGSEGG